MKVVFSCVLLCAFASLTMAVVNTATNELTCYDVKGK